MNEIAVVNGWLVHDTGEHNCAGGDVASSGHHEAFCGTEPVVKLVPVRIRITHYTEYGGARNAFWNFEIPNPIDPMHPFAYGSGYDLALVADQAREQLQLLSAAFHVYSNYLWCDEHEIFEMRCGECNGSGWRPSSTIENYGPCDMCDGSGRDCDQS